MRVRPSAAVVASVTGVLLLAGCAGDPSAAAVVDGRTITRAEVEAAQDDLSGGGGVSAGQVLWTMAIAPLYIDAAAQEGVGISSDEARAALAENPDAGGADGEIDPATVEIARAIFSATELEGLDNAGDVLGEVNERIAALDVRVNPRYGRLDQATGTLEHSLPAWIVGADDGTGGDAADGGTPADG